MTTTTKSAAAKSGGGLYRKILAVQQKLDAVPKRGYNSFHKYHYATEADILSVKETLNDNGLVVLPTTVHEETGFKPDGKSWASVTLMFKVVDVESGESIDSQFTGYAEDSFDKAIYKATTGANKYFYLKFFGIATEDDPEREDAAPVRAPYGAPRTGSVKPAFKEGGKEAEQPAAVSGNKRNQALVNANKILALQKQYELSNDEVLFHGEIESIKELAEEGNAEALAQAYMKLANHVRLQQKAM
jgi:hypothetical protein